MKKLLFGTVLLVGLIIFPFMSLAQVNVQVKVPIPLPPPIPFIGPPNVVVLPGTDVYAVPDVEQELFFRGGWWWRPWGGHWYRSKYHDHGWAYYRDSPSWYRGIPRDWRGNYRNHMWGGHPWNPPHINHSNLNNHWRGGHWRNDHGWARPKPPRGRTLHGGGPGGADLAVVPVDVLYMTAERVDAHIRTGEWIDVMVAVLIVVIVGNGRSLYIKSVVVMRYLRDSS